MKVKHIWTIVCLRSLIDSESNNLSIIDSLEQLKVDIKLKELKRKRDEIMVLPLNYEVVSFWIKDMETEGREVSAELKIELVDPNGKILKEFVQPLEMPKRMNRIRMRYKINGFGVTDDGYYYFRTSLKMRDGEEFGRVAEIPVEVTINKEIEE